MIETSISLSVYRKEDIEAVERAIKNIDIETPVFIVEYENSYHLYFTAEYEHWELESALLAQFDKYEFTKGLGSGRKEIRIELNREQSPFSTDGWGRRLEDPIKERKFMVKESKSKSKNVKYNPKITVLFDKEEKNYFVNIIGGENTQTKETGFLILDEFSKLAEEEDSPDIAKQRLFSDPIQAFSSGLGMLEGIAEEDYEEFVKEQKRKRRKRKKNNNSNGNHN